MTMRTIDSYKECTTYFLDVLYATNLSATSLTVYVDMTCLCVLGVFEYKSIFMQ